MTGPRDTCDPGGPFFWGGVGNCAGNPLHAAPADMQPVADASAACGALDGAYSFPSPTSGAHALTANSSLCGIPRRDPRVRVHEYEGRAVGVTAGDSGPPQGTRETARRRRQDEQVDT
ncbi:hypothetical protein SGFS_076620 [Streptomyces graminofaciens]|uniref:Uncharacterized protein n=1 Tax=Streptomyces graminofaciens TaxID=68212 RepID=A0ABN5VS87_9ACTN|nr:hypothetical protein SGFS_076620 [Streptomyces graminofaciens]